MLAAREKDPVRGFHFSHEVEAVFGDMDAMGHVNNVVYLRWLETARIDYWISVTGQSRIPGAASASRPSGPGLVSGTRIDMILARTEIDYRSPVSYGEILDVFIRTGLIRRSSLIFEYAIQTRSDQRMVAEAKTVVVCYDYEAGRKKPVSDELRTAILSLDPEARVEI